MDCLNNIIGLEGCGVSNGDAQLFVNQLPGITSDFISALVNDDHETFSGLWNNVKLRTMKKFMIIIKAKINKCYTITDNEEIECVVCEKADLFDVALWYLHGCELMIECTSSDTINRYTTVDLEKIERLKSEYYSEFDAAANDAVRSINPKDSDCIEGCVKEVSTLNWEVNLP